MTLESLSLVKENAERLTGEAPLSELQGRAGALAREFGRQYQFNPAEWRVHYQDMVQTALLAFLENGERPLPYATVCAQAAFKSVTPSRHFCYH